MTLKYKGVEIQQISLFKCPGLYLSLLFQLIIDVLIWFKNFIAKYFLVIVILSTLWLAIEKVELFHEIKAFIVFALYWIILGVASSIGLGTGLHTFVLYLGPHIAKVAIVATNCGHIPQMIPSRWEFEHFGVCREPQSEEQAITLLGILLTVQLEAFLWGLGTALGELPPYFVARKAAETRAQLNRMEKIEELRQEDGQQKAKIAEKEEQKHTQQDENLAEIRLLKQKANLTFMERAKLLVFNNIEKYGFVTILLCASIPNPLFDLAGVTCGHFRIKFRKFFSATFIGKAIIKVHIQMVFVILAFRRKTMDYIIQMISGVSQSAGSAMLSALEKQRELLHAPKVEASESWVSWSWNMFITLMIGYFVMSIISGQVKEKALKLMHPK